jgi:hypothetical protein
MMGRLEWPLRKPAKSRFIMPLYLPLYSFPQNDGATFNGFKLRELFLKPHAADRFFSYGILSTA